jgi:hypothetical protein
MDNQHLRQRTDEILRERIRLGMTGGDDYDSMGMGYGTHEGAIKGWITRREHEGMGEGYGTHEGALKGWVTRRRHGGSKSMGNNYGGKYGTERISKLARSVRQGFDNPPLTMRGSESLQKKIDKLLPLLVKREQKGIATVTDIKMLDLITGRRQKKRKNVRRRAPLIKTNRGVRSNCRDLKTDFRQAVCYTQKHNPHLNYREAMHWVQGNPVTYTTHKRKYKRRARRLPCEQQRNPWLEYLCRFREQHEHEAKYKGLQGNRRLMHDAAIQYDEDKPIV